MNAFWLGVIQKKLIIKIWRLSSGLSQHTKKIIKMGMRSTVQLDFNICFAEYTLQKHSHEKLMLL